VLKNLEKPLVFFDLETTGVRVDTDRIVEIALVKINIDGARSEKYSLINPQIPIPVETSRIHGITDERVKNAPTFKSYAPELFAFLEGCDLAGYNLISFDLPLLQKEFERVEMNLSSDGRSVIDPFVIFKNKERRNLSAAYQFYCGKEMKDAHTAMADITATVAVLEAQLQRYSDLPQKINELHVFCNQDNAKFADKARKLIWNGGEICLNFGKHRGRSLSYLVTNHKDYLQWMAGGDFAEDTKKLISEALSGKIQKESGSMLGFHK
jgi:DNA polymerase-3 subunit epsilon